MSSISKAEIDEIFFDYRSLCYNSFFPIDRHFQDGQLSSSCKLKLMGEIDYSTFVVVVYHSAVLDEFVLARHIVS